MSDIVEVEIGRRTPPDRVRAWTDLLDRHCMGVECRNAGDDLRASLKIRPGANGAVTRAVFTGQTLFRTPALIRRAAEETVLLAFVQSGRHAIRQGRKSAELDGCGTYVLDGSRPFEVDFASNKVVQGTMIVPKAAITSRLGSIEDLAFGPEAPLQKLLSTFATGVIQSFETLDAATLDALLNQTLDLFALMVAERKGGAIAPSTHRAGTLLRIKAYVKAHLRDGELSLEGTARALGISSRYLNRLLAEEGTSFGRYVLAERLDAARQEIMDPRRVHRQVAEVAYGWGFKNISHFGRAFKERYGRSPRDAKLSRS